MYLKELSINGFKSFAKKSELEFSTPITAIVGPNGSGKSNVAESFRFVLGEQSIKSLRGTKGEDLIWGGSDAVSRGNRAGVEVTFDNTSRAFALDFDEVKIERIVHRDGQNEYKLNGSAVRLKDIHELLAGAHIGATGHHIISQGEADRVLAAGAKERREMIEDALGLKVYQLKKQDSQKKLDKTHVNITQVESLRREAAPHLRYLKKQVEKAERALEVQATLKKNTTEYLKREDLYVAYHFDRLSTARQNPAEELERVTKKLATIKHQLSLLEEKPVTPNLAQAEAAFQEASRARQQLEQERSKLEGQVQFLESRLNRPATKPPAMVPRAEVEVLLADVVAERDQAIESGEVAVLITALNHAVEKLQKFLQHEKGETVDSNAADHAALAELRHSIKDATTAVTKAEHVEVEAKAALEQEQAVKSQSSEQARESERTMFELMNTQRELENQIRKIDDELRVLERDRTDFKTELQEAVALLGRDATTYMQHELIDAAGALFANEAVYSEPRSEQRERRRALEKLKIRLEELGVGATEELLKEYKDAEERDAFLQKELTDLSASVENLQSLITSMEEKLHEQFVTGLERITSEFNSFFTLMFGGGSAKLERVKLKVKTDDDEEEPVATAEGVELSVSLPNKRVKGLEMLSGGERALTSIALIFAMSQVNPPPFIILDETDAALDEANSRRYGDMIQALAKKSQLILITHNRETMSRAGILYGITMGGDGASKVLSVKFDEAAEVAK